MNHWLLLFHSLSSNSRLYHDFSADVLLSTFCPSKIVLVQKKTPCYFEWVIRQKKKLSQSWYVKKIFKHSTSILLTLSFSQHASFLWKMTSSHCKAKKCWRGKVLLSELLQSCGQVTRSASACIYLTRTVSSLQESVVENTGEGGVAQGHPATAPRPFNSAYTMRTIGRGK